MAVSAILENKIFIRVFGLLSHKLLYRWNLLFFFQLLLMKLLSLILHKWRDHNNKHGNIQVEFMLLFSFKTSPTTVLQNILVKRTVMRNTLSDLWHWGKCLQHNFSLPLCIAQFFSLFINTSIWITQVRVNTNNNKNCGNFLTINLSIPHSYSLKGIINGKFSVSLCTHSILQGLLKGQIP